MGVISSLISKDIYCSGEISFYFPHRSPFLSYWFLSLSHVGVSFSDVPLSFIVCLHWSKALHRICTLCHMSCIAPAEGTVDLYSGEVQRSLPLPNFTSLLVRQQMLSPDVMQYEVENLYDLPKTSDLNLSVPLDLTYS